MRIVLPMNTAIRELAVEVRREHCRAELAVEVRRGTLRHNACSTEFQVSYMLHRPALNRLLRN